MAAYYQYELNIINGNSNSDQQIISAKSTNNIIVDNEDEIAEEEWDAMGINDEIMNKLILH